MGPAPVRNIRAVTGPGLPGVYIYHVPPLKISNGRLLLAASLAVCVRHGRAGFLLYVLAT